MTATLDLDKKVVLVTGGARGVGAGIAAVLAGGGAVPIACGRTRPRGVSGVCDGEEPTSLAGTDHPESRSAAVPEFLVCDVRDEDAVTRMIGRIVETHGRLDGVVNNAGGSPFSLAIDGSARFASKIVELNMLAPLIVAKAAYAVMRDQPDGGAIVNISSVSGHRPSPGTSAYGAAKAGLDSLMASLAVEWAPRVRVNSVVAGPIRTELSHLHYGDDAGVAAVADTIPMGRLATPEDVGNAVAFLLSPLASYITGTTLTVHGGGEKPAFLDAANAGNQVG